MKIDRLILMAFVVMAPAMTIHAKTLRALKTSSAGSSIEFIADSIEYRPDVTRLYGTVSMLLEANSVRLLMALPTLTALT